MLMSVHEERDGELEVEVPAKARRRRFTAEYKRKILAEAEAVAKKGELGALLRREGLYSSHLVEWRKLAKSGALGALEPKKRGPKPKLRDERDDKITKLERELARTAKRLEQAEVIIDVQKKLSRLMGIVLPEPEKTE
jgi:transposase-like protein